MISLMTYSMLPAS